MASYINKYDDAADYSADASARAALGKSTVSLEADSGKVHFDGVNVVVSRPQAGRRGVCSDNERVQHGHSWQRCCRRLGDVRFRRYHSCCQLQLS